MHIQPRYEQVIRTGLQHINCILSPSQQQGGLFLGDIISTKKTQLLYKNNISAVLCCSVESKSSLTNIQVEYIPALDNLEYDIRQHFQQTYTFIQKNIKQKKNVLVHCHAGISRSATILLLSFDEAHLLVKSQRPRIKPNKAFVEQLKQYEKQTNSCPQKVMRSPNQNQQNDGNLIIKDRKQKKLMRSESSSFNQNLVQFQQINKQNNGKQLTRFTKQNSVMHNQRFLSPRLTNIQVDKKQSFCIFQKDQINSPHHQRMSLPIQVMKPVRIYNGISPSCQQIQLNNSQNNQFFRSINSRRM